MGSTAWLLKSLFACLAMLIAAFMPWARYDNVPIVGSATQSGFETALRFYGFNMPNWLPFALSVLLLIHALLLWLDVKALRSATALALLIISSLQTAFYVIRPIWPQPETTDVATLLAAPEAGLGAYVAMVLSFYLLASLLATLAGSRKASSRLEEAIEPLPQAPPMPAS
jgi:hypothetical protein